jgi:cellulose synthase/poly-beta-1,6-N-acetylglucosamine synthase-like glycosyltransferase
MHFWLLTFFISIFLVFYNYAGYAIIAVLLNKLQKKPKETFPEDQEPIPDTHLPSVSFIVAAYNEEDHIEEKIKNCLSQDYPMDKVSFIFVTDGSVDKTPAIVASFPQVQLLHSPHRKGKSAAMDRVVKETDNEILIFSDANTLLNTAAIRNICRHYQDKKVGGVAGEKKVLSAGANGQALIGNADQVGESEGLYWKYESFLKKVDSRFYSVVGAAGELFSLRRELYEPLPPDIILDDFVISLKVAQQGYRVVYEPRAYAAELPSFSLGDEQKRKIRIAAGGFQAMQLLVPLLAFWRFGRLSFLYISHRVLRWTASPLCLILAFLSNGMLAFFTADGIWIAFFTGQCLFYGLALLGGLAPSLAGRLKIAKLAWYFVFMNVSVILGFIRYLKGGQSSTWEKARRAQKEYPNRI